MSTWSVLSLKILSSDNMNVTVAPKKPTLRSCRNPRPMPVRSFAHVLARSKLHSGRPPTWHTATCNRSHPRTGGFCINVGKLCAVRATKVAGLRLCTTVLNVFAHMTARVGETRSCAAAQRQKCQPTNGLWSWYHYLHHYHIMAPVLFRKRPYGRDLSLAPVQSLIHITRKQMRSSNSEYNELRP